MPAKKISPASSDPIMPSNPEKPDMPEGAAAQVTESSPLPPTQVGQGDERTWATLAHVSVLLNLFTGFAGPVAAFIIYLVYRDRSRLVAYHAMQAMIFQLIWWSGGGILIGIIWAVVGLLSIGLIGLVLVPFAIVFTLLIGLLPLGALIYGVIAGIQVSQGQDFKYWLIGDWVRGILTG